MKLKKLFRPVGVKELELIKKSGMKAYPPRFSWQPIFYPVLNFEYAAQIAKEWNTEDEGSGFAGFVTEFEIPEAYFLNFKVQNVGGKIYEELWVPSERLTEFNNNIFNDILVAAGFYGDRYIGERIY
ncbi:hypothetical protein [Sporocytophaga myxococcoides]|uniref:hypothetical protein n=1 Tax=Sporocytophaga myxococcoides TaxID=153721 RepID=UPI0004174DDB|nr:hypothetical protein [Sporocytophaga myxococcoides]